MKNKPLLAIFAHPDDEAFSSGGTLAKYAKRKDIYLVCVTNGNDHTQPKPGLVKTRKKELKCSAKALGIKKVIFLNYEDGSLRSNIYHEVAKKIERVVKRIKPDTLLTMDITGISGHVDHIFVSLVVSYVFKNTDFVKKLMYASIIKEERKYLGDDYFIFVPEGRNIRDVDLNIDITQTYAAKIESIKCHKSQFKDIDRMIEIFKSRPKVEHFIVVKK